MYKKRLERLEEIKQLKHDQLKEEQAERRKEKEKENFECQLMIMVLVFMYFVSILYYLKL